MLLFIALIAAFVFGAISVVALEAAAVYYIVRRIIAKSKSDESAAESTPPQISAGTDLILSDHTCHKQGVIWILEPEKVPKISPAGEPNRRREFVEVIPVPRSATIKGKYLVLTESQGSRKSIKLKGCKVVAVSATGMSSKKWSKRYPIKVEGNNVLYGESKILYVYLETSWEKESWCKALRIASCDQMETVEWFSKLNGDFSCYLKSLSEGYTSFAKPSNYQLAPVERTGRSDTPSRVRLLWKKFAKKATKSALERKITNSSFEDSDSSSKTKSAELGSQVPDVYTEADEKVSIDEGTLCWNLLISRLFFDVKSNAAIKNALIERIQRTLSNMRTSSFIGALTCTAIDTGKLPPHIRTMRVVPMDMKETTWAFEMDVEYSGDMVLYIEVRLDVHDKDFQDGTIDPNVELHSADGVATDILQGFEHFGEKLNCSDESDESTVKKIQGCDSLAESVTSFKNAGTSSTSGSRWKSIVNSVAKHVAQVPFMLAIKVASLRGSMQLRIKPPPSDQIWFTFTSMPDIDFRLESFVGEHKFTTAHASQYLVNRFKAVIHDTLVFPNCESLCIPWMLAEKEDWVPRAVAPFTWLKQELLDDSSFPNDLSSNNEQPNELPTESVASEEKGKNPIDEDYLDCTNSPHYVSLKDQQNCNGEEDDGKPKRLGRKARMMDFGRKISEKIEEKSRIIIDYSRQNSCDDPLDPSPRNSIEAGASSSPGRKSLNELSFPLLQRSESPEHLQSSSGYFSLRDGQNRDSEEDESKLKKLGRKARMMDLGRKMGEKLEEKSRKLEEKSRSIVDKMRRQ